MGLLDREHHGIRLEVQGMTSVLLVGRGLIYQLRSQPRVECILYRGTLLQADVLPVDVSVGVDVVGQVQFDFLVAGMLGKGVLLVLVSVAKGGGRLRRVACVVKVSVRLQILGFIAGV